MQQQQRQQQRAAEASGDAVRNGSLWRGLRGQRPGGPSVTASCVPVGMREEEETNSMIVLSLAAASSRRRNEVASLLR
ncbi:unnamed protein product [Sphagnum jensenii]|uniref:Uncharacterized protein n=1 Tax=Sphagnum jensenii TaxID=128206 RepID=A0ABP0XI87_9BRYO